MSDHDEQGVHGTLGVYRPSTLQQGNQTSRPLAQDTVLVLFLSTPMHSQSRVNPTSVGMLER